jgi:two-component system sensor kinase FixL
LMRQPNALATIGIPAVRFLSWRYFEIGLAYLASYVFLDWVSFVYPFAKFGITPWNPPTGLSFALILLLGIDFFPWLFVAPVLTDGVVRGFALPFGAELATAFIIGGGYAAATAVVLSPRLQFDPALGTRQSLLLLLAVAVVSTGLVAASYVGTLVAFELVTGADYNRATLHFWIGELIGITVLTPFFLIFMTRCRMFRTSWEPLGLLVLTIAALWLEFGLTNAVRFHRTVPQAVAAGIAGNGSCSLADREPAALAARRLVR